MTACAHVHPTDDAIAHDTSSDQPDCICGPTLRLLPANDGALPPAQLIVHHSLDGREHHEHGAP
ncbi:hypothetical protein [Streptomyces synnematoformans]|uniref:Uncharacterized protein n=1 Tax=Streptomyces synnematoformans TaxID=415721 RepID=A0ABN2XAC4_9ACTN